MQFTSAERFLFVRFLEVDWEDFRKFAFGLFTEHLSSNWTIENIVHVCDSNRKDVQDFGKAELRKRLFGQEDMTQIDFSIQTEEGRKFLHRLSQHPYENIEHFTANNLLSQYVYGDMEMLENLRPYFKRVLSRVHKNRSVKENIGSYKEGKLFHMRREPKFFWKIFTGSQQVM